MTNCIFSLDSYLKELDYLRHFPKFQLERHVDVIFKMFLPEIFKGLNIGNMIDVIPEFPVGKKLLKADEEEYKSNDAIAVDLLAIEEDNNIFFIELKTDMGSQRGKQDDDLKKMADEASGFSFSQALEKILEIFENPNSNNRKYLTLLSILEKHGFIQWDKSIIEKMKQQKRCLRDKLSKSITITAKAIGAEHKIIKITPKEDIVEIKEPNVNKVINITFLQIVEINSNNDKFKTFQTYLKKWIKKPEDDVWEYLLIN